MHQSKSDATRHAVRTPFRPVVWALILASLAAVTCTSEKRSAAPRAVEGMKPAARHAVHSAELERVMERIETFRRHSWPQEVEPELESAKLARSRRAFARAAELSESLAAAAKQVSGAITSVELGQADRRAFLAKVEVFAEQVDRLRQAVADHDAERMRRMLRAIDTTCTSCHERFRDVSGPMDRS